MHLLVPGTIAPAREVHNNGFGSAVDTAVRIVLANLNLVVPVTSALLVIIVAIIFLCYLRKKGVDKGQSVLFCLSQRRYHRSSRAGRHVYLHVHAVDTEMDRPKRGGTDRRDDRGHHRRYHRGLFRLVS